MADIKDEILKEGSEARRYAVALRGTAYGDQLVGELFDHSSKMEKLYETATTLLGTSMTKDSKFQRFIEIYAAKTAWFEKAKAISCKTVWMLFKTWS